MSEEQDLSKLEDGIKLLNINFGRMANKTQHLKDSVQYFMDELVLFGNSLKIMNELVDELKKGGESD